MFVPLFLMLTAAELYNTSYGRIVRKPPTHNRYCLSAMYSYGVVSTELICDYPFPKQNGSTICTDDQVSLLCKYEGDGPQHVQCDPLVGTYSLTDYNKFDEQRAIAWNRNGGDGGDAMQYFWEKQRESVQWPMEPDSNPAYSYKLPGAGLVQRVYRVNDTVVEQEDCATLKVKVYDRDMQRGRKPGADDSTLTFWTTTKLPLPGEHGVMGGQWFIYSTTYQTKQRYLLMKVNFMVRYEQVRFVCHHDKGMDTIGTYYDSPDNRVKEDGIKALKEDMDIAPAKIALFNQPEPRGSL